MCVVGACAWLTCWRAGAGSEVDRTSADDVVVAPYNPYGALSLSQQREQLPVFQQRPSCHPTHSRLRIPKKGA
jgi:hypothetical protein